MRSITVTLSGELDLSMRDAVASALPEPAGFERLVVDCTAVTSIESVVIAVFMRYRRKWIAAGGDPLNIVFLVTPSLRRTFEITGMMEWFTIVNGEQSFSKPS
jgi:anti-anti-sigma factor